MAHVSDHEGDEFVESAALPDCADSSDDITHRVTVYQRLSSLGVPLPVPFDSSPKVSDVRQYPFKQYNPIESVHAPVS